MTPITPKCHQERSPFLYSFKGSTDSPNIDVFDTLATTLNESKCETLSRADISKILDTLELDAPLVDYLVAHGAISADTAKHLLYWDSYSEGAISKTDTLLNCLEIFDESVDYHTVAQNPKLTLLINALRSTGQHALASRLDTGPRILPSRFTNSPGTKNREYESTEDVELDYRYGTVCPCDITIVPNGMAKLSNWGFMLLLVETVPLNESRLR
ncbi:unnamed protein product [Dibothriocephalus latus]|uniref:Uncharacterized protein n=1 Tax=Dibothriocephalus latus TaxID=60516 RepID=A0A3P7KWA2_DIBLA|nr:unnamed protein product [Dibothriocephalus latus]